MSSPTFSLRVSDLHWLEGSEPVLDLCAHGTVEVRIGDDVLADNDLAVGPACVLLLRALDADHDCQPSSGSHLIPHCGHAFFIDEDGRWLNINCNDGLDWTVRHVEGAVSLSTRSASAAISHADWVRAVVAFCDKVEEFYGRSAPKTLNDGTAEGYEAFWREWRERRTGAGGILDVAR
jgi:hypothetical protein